MNYVVEASTLDDYGETVHTKSREHQQKYVVLWSSNRAALTALCGAPGSG